jgi:hypothetical protein
VDHCLASWTYADPLDRHAEPVFHPLNVTPAVLREVRICPYGLDARLPAGVCRVLHVHACEVV